MSAMTIGDGIKRPGRSPAGRSPSPVHVHVQDETPVHVHIQRPTAKAVSVDHPSRLRRSSGGASGVRRMKSPALPGPWIPPPGKTSKGNRAGDLWEPDEQERAQAEQYERKIDELLTDVHHLKSQREVERRDDLLEASRQILRDQEEEITEVKYQLDATEKENEYLRRSMDRAHGASPLLGAEAPREVHEVDEALGRRLVELELESDYLVRLLHSFTDLAKTVIREGRRVNAKDVSNLAKTRESLFEKIDQFELANRALRRLLRERHEAEGERLRASEQRDIMLKKVAEVEELNKRLQLDALERDRTVSDLRSRINEQRDENMSFANLQQSLEQTKGHLQKQLRQKEADCNRMAVQMRTLESQLAQEKIENEHLSDLLRQAKEKTERDKEQLKRATRAQKQRAARSEDTVEQLTAQLLDKDNAISELQSDLDQCRIRIDRMTRDKAHSTSESNQLRERVVELQEQVHASQDSLRTQMESAQAHISDKLEDAAQSRAENERLHDKIRTLENKLADSEKEASTLRASLRQYENLLAEHRSQNESQSSKLNTVYDKLQQSEDENKRRPRLTTLSSDADRRLKETEALNRELSSSLAKREDSIQACQARVEEKTRENSALMRQLEAAMAEARRYSEAARDKQNARERQLQSRVLELDSQLMQTRADMAKLRRERDEADRRFNSRLHDLKDRLEQSESSNRSMQNYIRYLKNSYANTFGDPPVVRGGSASPFVS